MSGVIKIEISESLEELQKLLSAQKTGKTKERLQVLYWLKSGLSQSVEELATRTRHHRTTVSRWLSIYRAGGVSQLLKIKKSTGRSRKLSPEIEKCLTEELKEPQGFASYEEVQTWLKVLWGVEMSYTGVHQIVRYRLKGKLKVPPPSHVKQKPLAIENFKKNLFNIKRTDKAAVEQN